jgi:hypothetical protein
MSDQGHGPGNTGVAGPGAQPGRTPGYNHRRPRGYQPRRVPSLCRESPVGPLGYKLTDPVVAIGAGEEQGYRTPRAQVLGWVE